MLPFFHFDPKSRPFRLNAKKNFKSAATPVAIYRWAAFFLPEGNRAKSLPVTGIWFRVRSLSGLIFHIVEIKQLPG